MKNFIEKIVTFRDTLMYRVWGGVKIVKSVKIGDNVIIGANSVVTHDIPSNSVAYGVSAKSYLR